MRHSLNSIVGPREARHVLRCRTPANNNRPTTSLARGNTVAGCGMLGGGLIKGVWRPDANRLPGLVRRAANTIAVSVRHSCGEMCDGLMAAVP